MTSSNVADLIVERFDLEPPVDIDALLRDVATVEEIAWSHEVDAMVTGLSAGGRPKVFLRENQPDNRKRFTSAHEYGHIQIPWHIESITCHIDSEQFWVNPQSEREANEFASRILVPRRFLAKVLGYADDVNYWLGELDRCKVSAYASLLALKGLLRSGYIFAIEDGPKPPTVVFSSGTLSRSDTPMSTGALRRFEEGAVKFDRVSFRGRTVRWYQYVDNTPPASSDQRASAEILEDILVRYGPELPDGRTRRNVLNGIIGGKLRNRSGMQPGEMLGLVKYHLANQVDWLDVLNDPEFSLYLGRRVIELHERDNK